MERGIVKEERLVSKGKYGNEDRISQLPDDLIHHIMSFLNTKHAVQTCVLSTRWLSIWKSLPYLNLDIHSAPFGDKEECKVSRFTTFISQLLSRRGREANLIAVRFNSGCTILRSNVLESVLHHALLHNAKGLDIRTLCPELIEFPNYSTFSYKSLTTLKLQSLGGQGNDLLNLRLPALKCLTLSWFRVRSQDFSPNIFSNFPNLESLTCVNSFLDGLESLSIRAPSLKMLDFTFTCEWIFYPPGFKVVIDAPKLMDFKFVGYTPMSFSSYHGQLAFLDQVYYDLKSDNDQEHVRCLLNNLKVFNHVKHLALPLQTIKALCKFHELLDKTELGFANLECLKLIVSGQCKDLVIPMSLLKSFSSSPLMKICW